MSAAAAAAAGPASAATVAKPATTRATILIGQRMADMLLPAAAPIETYIDNTVAALAEILQDAPPSALAGFDFSAQGTWTFARPGAPPLKPDQSLDDAAVVDGSLLTLVAASRTERYRPLVEDVIDAIAVLNESPQFDWVALHRWIRLAIPVVALAVAVIAVIGWARTGHPLWWPLGLGIGGGVALMVSWAARRYYQNPDIAESLLAAAYPLIAVAVALAIPAPVGGHAVGPPQYAAGAATVVLLTLATRGGPRRRIELASFTAVAALAVAVAALLVGFGGQHWVPAGAVAFGLFTVTGAAKLTVAVARFALPPVPAPGETVDNEELLDPVAGTEIDLDRQTPTWRAVIESAPDSAVHLSERSKLAAQLLIGFVAAGVLVFAAGAIAVVVRGHFFIPSLVVAGLVAAVCGFRSRLYAERWCGWALLAAAVAVPIGVMIRLSLWYPHSAWIFLTILVAAGLVALAVVGAVARIGRISPVGKRILELLDGTLVASIIPMLLWITSVYDIVRNIRF
ncbi:MAG: type VII secretion integral membrane protein EccD [Mycobacterium sp.]